MSITAAHALADALRRAQNERDALGESAERVLDALGACHVLLVTDFTRGAPVRHITFPRFDPDTRDLAAAITDARAAVRAWRAAQ